MISSSQIGGVDLASDSSGAECQFGMSRLELIQSLGQLGAVVVALFKVTQQYGVAEQTAALLYAMIVYTQTVSYLLRPRQRVSFLQTKAAIRSQIIDLMSLFILSSSSCWGTLFKNLYGSVVSNRIGVKFGGIFLQVNMHRLTVGFST